MPSPLLIVYRWGRSPEQISRLNAKDTSKPVHHVNTGGVDAPLKGTDIGPVDSRAMGKLFLRQALSLSQFPQIERQYLSYFHPGDGTDLQSILLRSILDKIAPDGGTTPVHRNSRKKPRSS